MRKDIKNCDEVFRYLEKFNGNSNGTITFKNAVDMFEDKDLPIVCGVYYVEDKITGKKGVFNGKDIFLNWKKIIKSLSQDTSEYFKIKNSYNKHKSFDNLMFKIKNVVSEYDKDKLDLLKRKEILRLYTHENGFNNEKEIKGYTSYDSLKRQLRRNNDSNFYLNCINEDNNKITIDEDKNENEDGVIKLNNINEVIFESLEESYINGKIRGENIIIINKLSNGKIIMKVTDGQSEWKQLNEVEKINITLDKSDIEKLFIK